MDGSNSTDWLSNYTIAFIFYRLGNKAVAKQYIHQALTYADADPQSNKEMIKEMVSLIGN